MEQNHFLPYAKQSISRADIQEVASSLEQPLITRGEKCKEFEEKLASYCNAKYAVLFTSATTALYAAFQAAKVSSADRFLTTPNSFIATVAAGMHLGAKPHFIDIDPSSGNMCLESLKEALIEPPTRGRFIIAPVHFSGIALDMKELDRLIKTPDVVIIEDAAHALGSLYPDGSKVGSCSHSQMTVFSFHAIKTITTGEGGAVTTNDDALYHRLLKLRNSGIQRDAPDLLGKPEPWYYEVQELSGNYHMNEMQAALGLSQLKRLDAFVQKRREIVSWYRNKLKGVAHIKFFDPQYDERTAYHLMVLMIDFAAIKKSRTEVMQELAANQIGSQYHYIPLYRHPVVAKSFSMQVEDFPAMERYYKEALSVPLYFDLEEKDVQRVCKALKKIVAK